MKILKRLLLFIIILLLYRYQSFCQRNNHFSLSESSIEVPQILSLDNSFLPQSVQNNYREQVNVENNSSSFISQVIVNKQDDSLHVVRLASLLKSNIEVVIPFTKGMLSSSTGVEQTNNNRLRTDYIDVDGIASISFFFEGSYYVHLYDHNKRWLGFVFPTKGELVFDNCVNCGYDVKKDGKKGFVTYSDIKYVRIWFNTSNKALISIKCRFEGDQAQKNRKNTSCAVISASHQGSGIHSNVHGKPLTDGKNMLSSVWGAYNNGYDMILCNQMFTADGICVCSHDGVFTDDIGKKVTIKKVTYEELKTHTIDGEAIPTLDSVIYLAKMLGMKVWLVNAGADTHSSQNINFIINVVKKYQMWENTWFMTSVSKASLITKANARAKLSLLAGVKETDINTIKSVIDNASRLVNTQNEVVVWISGENSLETFEAAALYLPTGVKLGFYNNQGSKNGDNADAIIARLPYVSIYSSKSPFLSIYLMRDKIEKMVEAKFPEINQTFSGLIIKE